MILDLTAQAHEETPRSTSDEQVSSGPGGGAAGVDARLWLATHEAGHAVVGTSLGLSVVEISMAGDGEDPDVVAYTLFDPPAYTLTRQHPNEMGVAVMAGTIAERRSLVWPSPARSCQMLT